MRHISPLQLADWLDDAAQPAPLLLDVREAWEFDTCHIDGARLLPMQSIPQQLAQLTQELGSQQPVVCICHHGARSLQVAAFLEQNGFSHITNLTGGIHAWAQQVDSGMATY